jgi:hypothetical protein
MVVPVVGDGEGREGGGGGTIRFRLVVVSRFLTAKPSSLTAKALP